MLEPKIAALVVEDGVAVGVGHRPSGVAAHLVVEGGVAVGVGDRPPVLRPIE
jgi:hypothetical protein